MRNNPFIHYTLSSVYRVNGAAATNLQTETCQISVVSPSQGGCTSANFKDFFICAEFNIRGGIL